MLAALLYWVVGIPMPDIGETLENLVVLYIGVVAGLRYHR